MHLFQKLLLVCLLCPLQLLAKEEPRVRVRFETSLGKFTVELYNETPKNRDNFISLVRNGYFKQTLFHRVIRDFMIQGGDPDSRNAAPGQRLGEGGPRRRRKPTARRKRLTVLYCMGQDLLQ